jgi:esterase
METGAPRSRFVEHDGLKLHHLEWGDAGRYPLVLVHGSRLHAHVWGDFGRRYADRHHIIAVDQRGHGESAWTTEPEYRLEELYRDLRAHVQAHKLSRYTLIGHSLGGRVSLLYAHRHQDELDGLVLVDITPARRNQVSAAPQAEGRGPREFDSEEAAIAYLARVMPRAPEHLVAESVRSGMRRNDSGRYVWKYDPRHGARRVAVPAGIDMWQVASEIRTRTLLQYGSESDVVNLELATRLQQTMPSCTVERIDGAGHGLFTDQPDAFAQSVERFLSARCAGTP